MEAEYRYNPEFERNFEAETGRFIAGYSTWGERFNRKYLWVLLLCLAGMIGLLFCDGVFTFGLAMSLVIIGPLVLAILGTPYCFNKIFTRRCIICMDGFIWQVLLCNKYMLSEKVVKFSDANGIRKSNTVYSQLGISYLFTEATLSVIDSEGKELFSKTGYYVNEHEEAFYGFAFNGILERWNEIAAQRLNKEFEDKGYCTFFSDGKEYRVGHGYLSCGNDTVRVGEFSYKFHDSFLSFFPPNVGSMWFLKSPTLVVPLSSMYNNQLFLAVIRQMLNIA